MVLAPSHPASRPPDDYWPPPEPPDEDPPPFGIRPTGTIVPNRTLTPAPVSLVVLDWNGIMAEPPIPPPMLFQGVPKCGVTVLAGAPKVGKTMLAMQRALESRVPTLLIIEEGSRAGIAYRLRVQADALGITNPPIQLIHRQGIKLDNRQHVQRIRDLVKRTQPELVVFDPLNRLHGADENRPTQMTPVMDALASIAYEHNCAVVALHHLAKPSMERAGGSIWDRFRGATSIRSGTDANLALDGNSADHVHFVGEFRDADPISTYLDLDRETLLFSDAEPADAPSKVDPIALRAFVEERGQVIAKLVMEQFGCGKHTALKALRALGCDEYPGPRNVATFTLTGR